ncbi:unnamed protein product [Boreogadus saida]
MNDLTFDHFFAPACLPADTKHPIYQQGPHRAKDKRSHNRKSMWATTTSAASRALPAPIPTPISPESGWRAGWMDAETVVCVQQQLCTFTPVISSDVTDIP